MQLLNAMEELEHKRFIQTNTPRTTKNHLKSSAFMLGCC